MGRCCGGVANSECIRRKRTSSERSEYLAIKPKSVINGKKIVNSINIACSECLVENERIFATTANENVIAAAANEDVITVAADENIISIAAIDYVIAAAPPDGVIHGIAEENVGVV